MLFAAILALAVARADTLMLPPDTVAAIVHCRLDNHDRLSGALVTVTADCVELAHPVLGAIGVARTRITYCESTDSAARIALGGMVLPPFAPHIAGRASVRLALGGPAMLAPPPLVPLPPRRRLTPAIPLAAALATSSTTLGWTRRVGASYAQSRGNANTSDLGFTGTATRRTARSQITLELRRRFGRSDGLPTADFFATSVRYDLAIGRTDSAAASRPSFFSETQYEHDLLARVARRTIVNTGLSIPITTDSTHTLAVEVGAGVTHERPSDAPPFTRGSAVLRVAARQHFAAARASQKISAFPDLTGPAGHYRVNSDLDIAAPLTHRVALTVGLTNRYDTHPQPNVRRADTTLQSGIGIEF